VLETGADTESASQRSRSLTARKGQFAFYFPGGIAFGGRPTVERIGGRGKDGIDSHSTVVEYFYAGEARQSF
jgi:hypothetical protein